MNLKQVFLSVVVVLLIVGCTPTQEVGRETVVEVTRIVEIIITQVPPGIPSSSDKNRQPSQPVFQPFYDYDDCDPAGNTVEMAACKERDAYQSAEALDAFLAELDQQVQVQGWEWEWHNEGLLLLHQDEWEESKLAFCKLKHKDNYGGSIMGLLLPECMDSENKARLDYLEYVACQYWEDFDWDCENVELELNSERNYSYHPLISGTGD